MRFEWQTWLRWAAVVVAGLLAALAVFLLFCFYTPPGHRVVASLVQSLSGETVAIKGLSGSLPNHLSATEVELRDAQGPWLKIEGVKLDWKALGALTGHIRISHLHAARVTVLRRHVAAPSTSTSTTEIEIADISLPHVELRQGLLRKAAVLSGAGSLHYASRHDLSADLSIRRLDAEGRYDVHAVIERDIAKGTIAISEAGDGIIGGLIGLPDLGPVTMNARAAAQGSANTLRLSFSADLLNIFAGGTIDLAKEEAALDFSAVAPDMHPSPSLSWGVISARGHLHGGFAAPDIDASLRIARLSVSGTRMEEVRATVTGSAGKANLHLIATGLTLPGETAPVFASAPVDITAHAELGEATRPIEFVLSHPLLRLSGEAMTKAPISAKLSLVVPSLGGLAPLTGTKLDGAADFALDVKQAAANTELALKGTIATQGDSTPAKLLGKAKLEATASLGATGNVMMRAKLQGAAVKAEIAGSQNTGKQSFTGEAALSDLSRLASTLVGSLNLRGSLTGQSGDAKLVLNGSALAAPKGMARQSITLAAEASGLPKLKAANLRVSGRFSGAPVSLKADVTPMGQTGMTVRLTDASWRSLRAQGTMAFTGKTPAGGVRLSVARLADLAPLTGMPLSGSVEARADLGNGNAALRAAGTNIAVGENKIGRIEIGGTIASLQQSPVFGLTISVPQLATPQVAGAATLRLSGPLTALSANLETQLTAADGQYFTVSADALADTAAKHVTISRFNGVWKDQRVTLAQPATLDYANGLKFAASFIEGKAVSVSFVGFVPSNPRQSMNVRATGSADLAVIGSSLSSIGQSVRGKLAMDVTITGTADKPNIVGQATLTGAQFQDYTRGLSLTGIEAVAEAQGPSIRLTKFTAKAGPGNITGSGTIDLAAPGRPVDIAFKASNARPMSSDLLTATINSDLKLEGNLSDRLTLSGQVNVQRGNINIPEKFASEVATLNVRRTRQPQAAPPAQTAVPIILNLTISSPGQIFVRGRGLEAEFEGDLKIGGTSTAPQVSGGLELRRGTLALAGASLTFQSGSISFNGQALRKRLDPSLNLVAQSQSNGITATLKITGTASQPKLELSSSPQLPQDEILAQLLFQQSAKSLSAMQLASVAQAAATLSGGGGGFDPVGTMRQSLGLDRLAVGSSQETSGGTGSTTIEAGKYVLRNVYIGAKQDLSGGTKALVQVDITKHLKAQAQVNTGPRAATTTSTPMQDNGDSIGLSYQFEY
ncbi:translocation and assembly module TamB [Rhizomicrobium palustre]|uniref:Translocation and assembly module TamB n=1 Tax=Rhizomicrobium palustre TaxID=189966 RepID=A0A846N039_9PROT|nr:translocation/assembly module TamB domain-containing protein [Rhizomicrobium palustre]NIK89228.1 translocation and assembly module TamB [Rhizomicrobium palustre]